MTRLDEHVSQLLAWIGQAFPLPPFEKILVFDTHDPSVRYVDGCENRWELPEHSLQTLEGFRERFDEVLGRAYPWVNLSLYGYMGSTLIVGIELPTGRLGTPSRSTCVNYSGPRLDPATGQPDWQAPVRIDPA